MVYSDVTGCGTTDTEVLFSTGLLDLWVSSDHSVVGKSEP